MPCRPGGGSSVGAELGFDARDCVLAVIGDHQHERSYVGVADVAEDRPGGFPAEHHHRGVGLV